MRSEEAFATGLVAGAVAVFVWLLTPPKPKVEQTKQIPPPQEELDEYVGFDRDWWSEQLS